MVPNQTTTPHLATSLRLTARHLLISGLLISSASAFQSIQLEPSLQPNIGSGSKYTGSYNARQTSASFRTIKRTTSLSATAASADFVSIERTAPREIDYFQGWAGSCGVQAENGFCLQGQMIDGNEDYYAATSSGAASGSRMLYVPGEMILSAYNIAQEYNGYADASLQMLAEMDMQHLNKHFHLFLKVLVEYEKGSESPYMPWLNAMPRKWNTAVSMGEYCKYSDR